MNKLEESRGLELHLEGVVMFSYWEDDCDYLDGWCDPEFKGLRVVLDGSFFPPLQVKEFVGGYIESLSYGYLTPDTFPKIFNYLIEFGYPRALIDRVANEMGR